MEIAGLVFCKHLKVLFLSVKRITIRKKAFPAKLAETTKTENYAYFYLLPSKKTVRLTCVPPSSCFFPLLLLLFIHHLFTYLLILSILTFLLPIRFCFTSSLLSLFLVLCTCCFYYQPLAMHIYWLQRSYLIQHVQRVRVNLPPPLAYIQPCLLSLVTQTPIIYCVIY